MSRTYFSIIRKTINAANEVIDIKEKTDVDVTKIVSIFCVTNRLLRDNSIVGSMLRLLIDNKEIFPEKFDAEIVLDNELVSWKSVKKEVGISVKSSQIIGKYTDGGQGTYPYQLSIYLEVEKSE